MRVLNVEATIQNTIYYLWGQLWASSATVKEERFASMEQRDAETGLDPTLFRMYKSRLYRWLSPDPVAGSILNRQSLNRYAYALNNPVNLTALLGLSDRGRKEPSGPSAEALGYRLSPFRADTQRSRFVNNPGEVMP